MKVGDIVVINAAWDNSGRRIGWLPSMDTLVGQPGVITERYSMDTHDAASESDVICWRVKTYCAEEIGPVESGFIYYEMNLRPATEDEKRAFLLVELVRKI